MKKVWSAVVTIAAIIVVVASNVGGAYDWFEKNGESLCRHLDYPRYVCEQASRPARLPSANASRQPSLPRPVEAGPTKPAPSATIQAPGAPMAIMLPPEGEFRVLMGQTRPVVPGLTIRLILIVGSGRQLTAELQTESIPDGIMVGPKQKLVLPVGNSNYEAVVTAVDQSGVTLRFDRRQ